MRGPHKIINSPPLAPIHGGSSSRLQPPPCAPIRSGSSSRLQGPRRGGCRHPSAAAGCSPSTSSSLVPLDEQGSLASRRGPDHPTPHSVPLASFLCAAAASLQSAASTDPAAVAQEAAGAQVAVAQERHRAPAPLLPGSARPHGLAAPPRRARCRGSSSPRRRTQATLPSSLGGARRGLAGGPEEAIASSGG